MYARNEKIIPVYIEEEMKDSYINYAMSVIVGRALPDARDGLKPVHRRILYAMKELGVEHNKPYKKSARIVGDCFVKDTLVASDKGLVAIQDIERGDFVYTQTGLKKVTALFEMPAKNLVKITLGNGTHNTVTPSQKIKVLNNKLEFVWKEAKDLTCDDHVVIKSAYPDIRDKVPLGRYLGERAVYLNENIAYLLGLFLSDGWIEKRSGRLCFYSITEEIIHRIHKILRDEFSYEAKIEVKKYKYTTKSGFVKNTGYQIRVHKRGINEFLTNALCLKGMRSLTKKIPAQIFSSPSAVIWAFVSGLVDGDGSVHVNRNVAHYCSISEELINQLQILLQHQNVLGFRYSEGPHDGHVVNGRFVRSDNKSYSLEFRGTHAHLMASCLSLASPEKSAKIITMLTREQRDCWSSLDAIPYAGKAVFKELSEAHLGGGWYKNGEGKKFRAGIKYQGGSKIRYSTDLWDKPLSASQVVGWGIMDKLRQIESPLFNFIDEVMKERLHFVRVDSVKESPAEKTYDIQVADDHEFIANGMLSHNCMGKYHPHGDTAIYDTLVRMAQDFSLRYTLVEGQGNFGCFTIDTKVKLTDGRSASFGELIEEDIAGKKNYTFTFNDKVGKVEISQILRPRLTKKNAAVMKITLDNNEEIKCTLNHKFMLRDGTYKEAQELVAGSSLMPLLHNEPVAKDCEGIIARVRSDRSNLKKIECFAPSRLAMTVQQPALNHKVLKVEFLAEMEDVYDLTINTTHNFALAAGVFVHNSVDGDAAASMRYTEARLDRIADWMLLDIEKNTVDFMPNFDGSLKEPTVLPACLPNLLVNGSSGIAVGMATNIPPHNLTEITEAVMFVIDNPGCDSKDLIKRVKGPDFPTGGIIRGTEGIKNAYTTGRGLLRVHAKAFIEEQKNGKEAIIIKELPYQVNKANLVESIADLVTDKKIDGITDLRDESDKDGMRVVIEVRRGANSKVILNQLYKHTQMQTTFGVIMLALVDGRPRVLNLKEVLSEFIRHRKEIITRRTKYDLEKAQDRAHILEGLKIALKELDRVIKIIRAAKDPQEAKVNLMDKIGLSDRQAQAILEMQLQRLTHLERDKIDKEYLELIKKIELFRSILESEKKVLDIIKEEMKALNEKFGDARRTEILPETEELDIEDLIAEEDVVITISHTGYLKRLPVSSYRKQRRGGRGVTGADMKEEDFIEHLFIASTHDYMLFFTDKGIVHWLKVYEIPEASRTSKGRPIINLLQIGTGEKVSAFVPVRQFKESEFLVMATKNGTIKKTTLTAYSNPRKGGIIGITLEKDDELIEVQRTDGNAELLMATREGKAIRFKESQVRDMGRGAKGVRGINLGKKDSLIAMAIAKQEQTILTVTQEGFGKRTPFKEYRLQSRGGKGIINIKVTGKNGEAVGIKTVSDKDELMLITEKGMIVRSPVKDIRSTGRSTQGVRLMKLDKGDKIASVAKIIPEDEVAEEEKIKEAESLVKKEAPATNKEEDPKPKEETETEKPKEATKKEAPKKKATKRKK